MMIFAVLDGFSQTTVSGDLTGAYSFGLAAEDQSVSSGEVAMYDARQNGYYTAADLIIDSKVSRNFGMYMKLRALSRPGSPYQSLQSLSATPSAFSVAIDSVYGKINAFDSLRIESPVDLFFKAGKYSPASSNYQTVTKYGIESALNMIKIGNNLNVGLEAALQNNSPWRTHTLVLQLATNTAFNEFLPRLYDVDGSMSRHGKEVLGEYAPQLFASLKLENYKLALGTLSAECDYALNGADIYSGTSAGAAAKLTTTVIPSVLAVPFGIGAAYYEKNIDTLGATAGATSANSSIDFRNTVRAGFGTGFIYETFFRSIVQVNLGASYTRVEHIYRDPVSFVGLALDGRFTYHYNYYVGAGCIAGTLTDVKWKTKSSVTSMYDDYSKTFTLKNNFGYEVYAGVTLDPKCNIMVGYNNNKGLAMNYALESMKDGQIKYRQKNTAADDRLYEAGGIYLKAVMFF